MEIEKRIDWLSITLPIESEWRNFIPFPDLISDGKGRHGYAHKFTDRYSGAVIETAAARDDMGHHLTLSGDVLSKIRHDLKVTDAQLVDRVLTWDGQVSRIDLAIDLHGASFTPSDLALAIQNQNAHIRARRWRLICGVEDEFKGETFESGSPKSDKRIRVYDKNAEQKIKDGESWIRLEAQLRRLSALSALTSCAMHGVPATASGVISGALTWNHPDLRAGLVGACTLPSASARTLTNRQRWLMGQVAKSLADESIRKPEFIMEFFHAVNFFRSQYSTPDSLTKN